MKIAHFHHNLARESGDPRMALEIMHGLKKAGHSVVGYTHSFNKDIFNGLSAGLDVRVVATELNSNREKLAMILSEMETDFDIVIFQNDYSYQAGLGYKKINPSSKTIWIMNNAPFEHLPKPNIVREIGSRIKSMLAKKEVKKFMEGIDHIIVHDEKGREFAEMLGKPSSVISIGVDFDTFYVPVRAIRSDRPIQLLGVGSLSIYRRFEDIVDSVKILRKRGVNIRALLICKDFGKMPAYRAQFQDHINRSQVEKYVEVRFGGASDDELLRAYQDSDIYIFPNHVRIWGMSALEAMAAGKPLVVSRITSVAEILHDDEDALFVDPGQSDQIAHQVQRLISDSELYLSVASSGQKFVKEFLSWDKYVEKFEGVLSKMEN